MPTAADALLGAGHILAEQFSERADLRQALRKIVAKTGKLVSSKVRRPTANRRRRPARASAITSISASRSARCRRTACWRSIAARTAKMLRVQDRGRLEAMQPHGRRAARAARASAREISARLRPRRARAAGLPEPGARGPPRADREGRDARRRGLRPQPAEPAAAAAAARPPRAGDRSRLQERLQAGGARRVRQRAGARRDPPGRQRRAQGGGPHQAGRADHASTS